MTIELSAEQRTDLEAAVIARITELGDASLVALARDLTDARPSGAARVERDRYLHRRKSSAVGQTRGTSVYDDAYSAQQDRAPARGQAGLTRRQALFGAVSAGVVGIGLGGAGGWTLGSSQLRQNASEAIETWRGLVQLYERLDNIGLDSVIARAMKTIGGLLTRLRPRIAELDEAIDVAEARLAELDEGLAILDDGLAAVERAVQTLATLLERLGDVLSAVDERAGPLGDRVAGFFRSLLERIPFGLGDSMLAVLDRIEALLASLPEAIETINTRLIGPLRARFFPREGESVRVRIIEPILFQALRPARALLDELDTLLQQWESELVEPANERLTALEELRQEIATYREAHGLVETATIYESLRNHSNTHAAHKT